MGVMGPRQAIPHQIWGLMQANGQLMTQPERSQEASSYVTPTAWGPAGVSLRRTGRRGRQHRRVSAEMPRCWRRRLAVVAVAVVLVATSGCVMEGHARGEGSVVTASPVPSGEKTSAQEPGIDVAWTRTKVARIVDGDTIDTAKGRVRIIGIDTPERGKCNYQAATAYLAALIPVGDEVNLGRVETMADEDRYGRLVRYVDTMDGIDVGSELIRASLAIARYDSRDGYGEHPREQSYAELEQSAGVVDCAA